MLRRPVWNRLIVVKDTMLGAQLVGAKSWHLSSLGWSHNLETVWRNQALCMPGLGPMFRDVPPRTSSP